jgi:hypothetical protein
MTGKFRTFNDTREIVVQSRHRSVAPLGSGHGSFPGWDLRVHAHGDP